jgi:hypothetical protein
MDSNAYSSLKGVKGYDWFSYGCFWGTKTTYIKKPHGSQIIKISNNGEHAFKTWIRLHGEKMLYNVQVFQSLLEEKQL